MDFPNRIGRYDILDELGQGTMGKVFRARDSVIGRVVAIKTILSPVLLGSQDEEALQRFYREARAAGALAHPGIVPIFDIGEQDGVPFLVMEFVDGQNLEKVMKRGERRSVEQVCAICQGVAEALGYAHSQGVIHRDIKPANILMTSPQAYGEERPKIADFGVAKLAADQLTSTGKFLGTPAFMPPEQFTGEPVDGRTDLFSLGVILYWMATGEQPFSGETITAVSYKVVHTEPIPPGKLNPAISSALDTVILKSLAKSPSDRFQTGEEFAEALAQLRSGTGATRLSVAAPRAVIATGESQETLDIMRTPPLRSSHLPASALAVDAPVPATQTKGKSKSSALVLGAIALVALSALAAAGYMVVHRKPPANAANSNPGESTSPVVPGSPAPATPAPSDQAAAGTSQPASASGEDAQKSAVDSSAPLTATPTTAPGAGAKPAPSQPILPATPQPATARASRQSAAAPFDPKKLDPQKNTRLKLDFSHFPSDLAVVVEMDGQVYFKGTAGAKKDYENLYAPPGVHEFRITIGASHAKKTSNIVSAEFIAKKRMSLKVELRPQPKGGAKAADLDPATQLIANLKNDRFF